MDSFEGFRRYCVTSLVGLGLVGMLLGATGCSKKPGKKQAETVGVSVYDASAQESSGNLRFRLVANPPLTVDSQISYSTVLTGAAGVVEATAGADYTSATGSVLMPAGVSEVYIDVAVTNDAVYEYNEVLGVSITVPEGITLGLSRATGTILNDDPKPQVSMALSTAPNGNVTEGPSADVSLDVTINGASAVESTVVIKDVSGATASFRSDYVIEFDGVRLQPAPESTSDDLTLVFPADETNAVRSGKLVIRVVDDGLVEGTESATISMEKMGTDTTVAAGATVNLVITDNDTDTRSTFRPQNDTGVITSNPNGTAGKQDADYGRDKLAGTKAFDFTYYDANGVLITDMVNGVAACAKDNVTGLVWEVFDKNMNSVRSYQRIKYWYEPDAKRNGGNSGTVGHYSCNADNDGSSTPCNTSFYAADVNLLKLCGLTGWRLPDTEELRGLVDYGRSQNYVMAGPFPDTDFEAQSPIDDSTLLPGFGYWTADTNASSTGGSEAWYINFALSMTGDGFPQERSQSKVGADRGKHYVRLVTEQTLP
ncbi:MAG: DUF1566 domain-containing protein [Gammaproteobacteria bacterium]|nr:DUF1566 domain-containing protein [Gammaproteobacteria bacterium]